MFDVPSAFDVPAQLRAAGAIVADDEEHSEFGWAVDCDGRRFELWQPPAAAKDPSDT